MGTKKTIIFDDVSKILLYDINIDSNYNHINNEFKEVEFDKNISPLTNEIKHFIEYIKHHQSVLPDLILHLTLLT